MEPTTIEVSEVSETTVGDMRIAESRYGTGHVIIDQDGDRIVVREKDIGELAAAIGKHAPTVEEQEPGTHITAEGVDMRIMRIVARSNIQQLRRDTAYEEGRITVLNSILGD